MEQKPRLIILVLAVVAGISLFAAIGLNNAKQVLSKEINKLQQDLTNVIQERDSLIGQVNSTKEERRRLQEKLDAVQKDLNQFSRERDDYRQRFELISREKEQLLEKIQSIGQQTQAQAQQPQIPAGTEDVYWANVLKERANLELQVSNLKQELKNMQIKVEEASRDKSNAELQVSTLAQEKQDFERKLQYNERLVELLSGDLVKETKDRRSLQEQLAVLKQENNGLKGQIKEVSRAKINLEKKLQAIEEQKSTLQRRIDETNVILEQKVSGMLEAKQEIAQTAETASLSSVKSESKSVELPPIIVRPQEEQLGSPLTGYEGRVIAINKENNFVVVDLGEEKGVKIGQAFKVYRQGRVVAAVEVIQTRRAISACDIRQALDQIRIGDTVKLE